MKAGGMERCCYFFWLGNDCSINEEGATAVMTIELDEEKGPQVSIEFRCISLYERNMSRNTVPFLRYKRQQSGNIWRVNVEIERDWCVMFGME